MTQRKVILAVLGLVLQASTVGAQIGPGKPYLVGAQIHIAAAGQADFWLNGIHIAHCADTSPRTGYKTVIARPDSLCYFKPVNLLAVRLEGSGRRFAGVAYVFQFIFSDGSTWAVDSSAAGVHRCLYLPSGHGDGIEGWQTANFDDSAWPTAQVSGDMIPDTVFLSKGAGQGLAGFLTANGNGYAVRSKGETQLFRRRFDLSISTNPRCLPQDVIAPPKLLWSQPMPKPVRSKPAPALRKVLPPVRWITPAILQFYPVPTPIPLRPVAPIPVFTATTVPTVIVQDDGATTFGDSGANLLATFSDGPGFYKVEVVSDNFTHLKTLLNQSIIAESQMWLTWDGKDDGGRDVPVGRYYVLCSKEGVVLQKIILRRVP